ncbi:hypothetical protein D4R51_02990 [bacterium]|nr:MAG: hypothetical protein D4R51_02990 [bacterium]
MDLKIRRTLFYSLILVFILVGAFLIMTAQGWVLDLKNLKIAKTGSLFLKYVPTNATVEINGKVSNASPGFITSGVLISRLTPAEYRVKISQPNFLPWEKKLLVGEAVVTSASQIKLWPEVWLMKEVATSSISNFWLTGQGAIIQTKDKALRWNDKVLRGQKLILSDPNFNLIVTSDGKNYFLTDLENTKSVFNLNDLFNSLSQGQSTSTKAEVIKNLFFHPFNGNRVLIVTEKNLYSLDLKRVALDKLVGTKGVIGAAISDNEVFLEDSSGGLTVFNLFLQTASVTDVKLPTSTAIKASPNGSSLFFLKNNGELNVYDRSLKKFTIPKDNISDFYVSPDERRLLLISKDNTVSMRVLNDYYADGDVKSGEEWAIRSAGDPTNDFKWLPDTPNYGMFLSGDKLIISELDRRTPQNAYAVSDEVKDFFVQGNNLYILKSDGTLNETGLR